MIIHRYEDGTEGYLYEPNDTAIIVRDYRYEGSKHRCGKIMIDKHDLKEGTTSLITFVTVYDLENQRCIESRIPVWGLEPSIETYKDSVEHDKIVNCICGKPVDEFFLNTL